LGKIINIYDADILAFRASAAVDTRSVKVTHVDSGKQRVFKNRTEFKDGLKLKGKEFKKEDWLFTDLMESEPLANALSIIKTMIERINEDTWCNEYIVAISGKSNFRDTLPLPSQYKGSRVGLMRPKWLKECKHYLWKNHPSIVADFEESDDVIIYKGYEYLEKGYTVNLCGIDKDSLGYSGLNFYDFTQEQPKPIMIPDFGYLEVNDKGKVKGMGFLWLCWQFLRGDPTDFFLPYELANVKFGDKAAYNLLKDCKTKPEAIQVVLDQYKKWYPEVVEFKAWDGTNQVMDYFQIAQMYFKCSKMKETVDDDLDLVKFLNRYGVQHDH
jgi:hypothetical protein